MMIKRVSVLCLLTFAISFLQGCAGSNSVVSNKLIQKRKYTKGFYFERAGFNGFSEEVTKADLNQKTEPFTSHFLSTKEPNFTPFTLASSKVMNEHEVAAVLLPEDECGDTLVYITGKSVLVNIISVGEEKITYTKCEDPNKREYSLSKDEAGYIHYLNGETDFFNDPDDPKASKKKKSTYDDGVIKDEPFALPSAIMLLVALIMGILFPIVGMAIGLLAAVFGWFSLVNYNKNPDKYTQRSMPIAWISIIFGSMLFGLFLIITIQNL